VHVLASLENHVYSFFFSFSFFESTNSEKHKS